MKYPLKKNIPGKLFVQDNFLMIGAENLICVFFSHLKFEKCFDSRRQWRRSGQICKWPYTNTQLTRHLEWVFLENFILSLRILVRYSSLLFIYLKYIHYHKIWAPVAHNAKSSHFSHLLYNPRLRNLWQIHYSAVASFWSSTFILFINETFINLTLFST